MKGISAEDGLKTEFAEPQLAPNDAFKLACFFVSAIVLAMASISGGMPAVLMLAAITLAARVYRHPKEAIVAGPLFLIASNVLLPSSSRFNPFDKSIEPWEMYYWAVGILLITLAAGLKVGYRVFLEIPPSLKGFLLVAVAASIFGLTHGGELSYVARQLFGSLLLVAYFALAQRGLDEESFLRTFRMYSIPCVVAFVGYYVYTFDKLGLHRETTTLGTQAVMLGIIYVGHRRLRSWLAAIMMLVPSVLLVVRRDIAVFVLGVAIMYAFNARSKLRRWLSWLAVGAITFASLAPPYVAMILDTAASNKILDQLIPRDARDASTIADRGLQLWSAARTVQESPVFGSGMGSALEYETTNVGNLEMAYVDNGWAYLVSKMGLAGTVVFLWFIAATIRRMPGSSVALSACVLSMVMLMMFAEPVFFHFTTSPLAGALTGLLYSQQKLRDQQEQ